MHLIYITHQSILHRLTLNELSSRHLGGLYIAHLSMYSLLLEPELKFYIDCLTTYRQRHSFLQVFIYNHISYIKYAEIVNFPLHR